MTATAIPELTNQVPLVHGEWTEEEYRELGERPDRIELFDGSLHVSPTPTPTHQHVSGLIWRALLAPARRANLGVYMAVNIRLKSNRILIPDLVIVDPIDPRELFVDGSAVRLVCEVTSPNNAATDRVLKMHYYAEAGIGWYLLVNPLPEVTFQLFRLEGRHYLLAGEGRAGHRLRLTDPVVVDLDPNTLEP